MKREMGNWDRRRMSIPYLNGALEFDEGVLLRGAARQEAVGKGGRDAKVIVAGLDARRGPRAQGKGGGGGEGDGAEGEDVDFAAAAAASRPSFILAAPFSPSA